MKISAKVHYAILIMTDIAVQGKNKPVSGNSIARRLNISFSFVAHLLNKLKHAGLLKSIRGGAGGGYILKKSSSKITLKQIINAIEPFFCICPSKEIMTTQPVDEVIRSFWQELEAEAESMLENTTIEDLAQRTKNFSRKDTSRMLKDIS